MIAQEAVRPGRGFVGLYEPQSAKNSRDVETVAHGIADEIRALDAGKVAVGGKP